MKMDKLSKKKKINFQQSTRIDWTGKTDIEY